MVVAAKYTFAPARITPGIALRASLAAGPKGVGHDT